MALGAIDKASLEFGRSLAKFKDKIIKKANGFQCGTCAHNIRGRCIEHHIDIFMMDAVACGSHTGIVEAISRRKEDK